MNDEAAPLEQAPAAAPAPAPREICGWAFQMKPEALDRRRQPPKPSKAPPLEPLQIDYQDPLPPALAARSPEGLGEASARRAMPAIPIPPEPLPAEVFLYSHESSNKGLEFFDARRLAYVLLQAEPEDLLPRPVIYEGPSFPMCMFWVRTKGKPGGGIDELRLEYMRLDGDKWLPVG